MIDKAHCGALYDRIDRSVAHHAVRNSSVNSVRFKRLSVAIWCCSRFLSAHDEYQRESDERRYEQRENGPANTVAASRARRYANNNGKREPENRDFQSSPLGERHAALG